MKIAIIGAGISGMVAARNLYKNHEITVYEANDYIGGHTNTIPVEVGGQSIAVDTGFIVFNDRTYPNFISLLDELEVASQDSAMSFSVRCPKTGIEYNGHSLNSLFAQRRNLLRPRFIHMLLEILRFNKEALAFLDAGASDESLGQFLDRRKFTGLFVSHYIVPMGAAIWSMEPDLMRDFPARYFLEFFSHHGLLSVKNRPQWRVVTGGSWKYVEKLTAPFKDRIRLSTPVTSVRRTPVQVTVESRAFGTEHFDHVVFACHSDQALSLLSDPSDDERSILGNIRYQNNEAVLHTDSEMLPKNKRAWAAWNYHLPEVRSEKVTLTYSMNILQNLPVAEQICVTLNRSDQIDPRKVLRTIQYAHPLYDPAGMAARGKHDMINGKRHTWYCGAYWGYGFHEDGVKSALSVCAGIKNSERNEQLHLSRAG